MFCGSSSLCHGLVCSVWMWYFLIILTFFFCHKCNHAVNMFLEAFIQWYCLRWISSTLYNYKVQKRSISISDISEVYPRSSCLSKVHFNNTGLLNLIQIMLTTFHICKGYLHYGRVNQRVVAQHGNKRPTLAHDKPVWAEWIFPPLSIGSVHFRFNGCWVVVFSFIQTLIEHSVSKQWRPWSDAACIEHKKTHISSVHATLQFDPHLVYDQFSWKQIWLLFVKDVQCSSNGYGVEPKRNWHVTCDRSDN